MSESQDTDDLCHGLPLQGTSQVPPGGSGGDSGVLLEDPHQIVRDLLLLKRAVRAGWNVPAARKKALAERVHDIGENSPDENLALQAARVSAQMDANDLQRLQVIDKIERLDHGQATENVGIHQVRVIVEEIRDEQVETTRTRDIVQ